MDKKRYDPNERIGLETEPEEALEAILGGDGVEDEPVDTVSDPGILGGVDAPNEGTEEPETEA